METKTIEKKKKKEKEQVADKLDKQLEETKKEIKEELKDDFKPKEQKKIEIKIYGETSIWKNLIHKVGDLKDEISLSLTKDGLQVKETDEVHVAMVDMTVKKFAFTGYKVSHNVKFGINLAKLNTHLKIFKTVTAVNGINQLIFKGESGRESKMGLLTVVDVDMVIPEIKYSVEMKTPAEAIQKMVEVGEDFNQEALKFVIKDKKFYIFVEAETDTVRFPICAVNQLDDMKDFETLYAVKYLKKLLHFDGKDNLILKFGKDIPLYINFEDSEQKIEYVLAPRIESE